MQVDFTKQNNKKGTFENVSVSFAVSQVEQGNFDGANSVQKALHGQ